MQAREKIVTRHLLGKPEGNRYRKYTAVPLHVKRTHRGVEGQLRTFLTWAVAGNKWSI